MLAVVGGPRRAGRDGAWIGASAELSFVMAIIVSRRSRGSQRWYLPCRPKVAGGAVDPRRVVLAAAELLDDPRGGAAVAAVAEANELAYARARSHYAPFIAVNDGVAASAPSGGVA